MIRCKFKVDSVTNYAHGSQVVMRPVTEGSKENEAFYKWTPGGELKLETINEDAAALLKPGKDYYIDIIPVE